VTAGAGVRGVDMIGALLRGLLLMAGAPVSEVPPAEGAQAVVALPEQAALAVIDGAIADGRLDAAAEIIARTVAREDTPALRLRMAELALARGSLAEAVARFQALLLPAEGISRVAPAPAPEIVAAAQQGLGLARLRQNDLAGAKAALDAALAIDPGLIRAWTARGVLADRERDFATANLAYGRAVALAPDSATVLTNQGYSLLLQRRHAEAEALLARAVSTDPNLAVAQTNLRLARALQGRYKEAFAGATPDRLAGALNTVGFAAMARGDYATAETYFNRALTQNTRFDAVAWANLRYLKDIMQPMTSLDPGDLAKAPGAAGAVEVVR
jgi:Flp pilus assembly protein TadD